MRRHTLIATVVLALAGAGCELPQGSTIVNNPPPGGSPDAGVTNPPPGGSLGLQAFVANVEPVLKANCASCHSGDGGAYPTAPKFFGPTETAWYATLTMNPKYVSGTPANSLLLTKGLHTGPAFLAADATKVSSWIAQEATDRMLPMDPPSVGPKTFDEALALFGKCMQQADWDSTGMNDIQNQNTTQGRCTSCHSTGTGGAYLGQLSTDNFTHNQMNPFILKLALGTVDMHGNFADLVPALRFKNKGQEGNAHPSYILSTARATALDQFWSLTYARYTAAKTNPAMCP